MKLPASVEVLGESCFEYLPIAELIFEEGSCLKRIEKSAFKFCGAMALVGVSFQRAVNTSVKNVFIVMEASSCLL